MHLSRDKWLLFGGLLLILFGLIMLASPVRFMEFFGVIVGIAVVLEGFVTLFFVRREIEALRVQNTLLLRGILGIAVGLVAIFLPLFATGVVWAIMLYLLAIEMIVSAIMEFVVVRELRALNLPVRECVAEGILLIALAIVLFIFPFQIATLFVRIVGAAVVIAGCIGIYRWKALCA